MDALMGAIAPDAQVVGGGIGLFALLGMVAGWLRMRSKLRSSESRRKKGG